MLLLFPEVMEHFDGLSFWMKGHLYSLQQSYWFKEYPALGYGSEEETSAVKERVQEKVPLRSIR